MLWKGKSFNKRFYIPGLTENKEIKSWVKKMCSAIRPSIMMPVHRFEVFPENSHHTISAILFDMFDERIAPRKDWRELEISHYINGLYIDAVTMKVKTDNSIHFEYSRGVESTIHPLLACEDVFYMDSDKIDWRGFEHELKLWCIEII